MTPGMIQEASDQVANVHFVKKFRKDPNSIYKQPVKVHLDDDLRGRVERFDIVKKPSPSRVDDSSGSRDRIQHVKKYSLNVNEINSKTAVLRNPARRTPKSRFDAQAYKKNLHRQLLKEIQAENEYKAPQK